jgi:hypothetical protein
VSLQPIKAVSPIPSNISISETRANVSARRRHLGHLFGRWLILPLPISAALVLVLYLTFLDVASLERIGSDTQTRLEEMQMINKGLTKRNSNNAEAIANMQKEMENMKNMMETLLKNGSSLMDFQQQTAFVRSLYESGWLEEEKE